MTSIQKIIDWVNDAKPIWWRHSIRLAVDRGELANEQLELIFSIAKMEVDLQEKGAIYPVYESPVVAVGFEKEEFPVNLLGLGNTVNISALVSDKKLKFAPVGLSKVYGDNGSGKSSYAKILKNACLTRGTPPDIISNVFEEKPPSPSSAVLTIQVGDNTPEDVQWTNGGDPNLYLKSIRVFDSASAHHYISKEDNIEYKPAGLKLLDELAKACNYVKSKIGEEKLRLPSTFTDPTKNIGTPANVFISTLNVTTTIEQVEAHCVTQEELESLDDQRKKLFELTTKSPEQLRIGFSKQKQRLLPFKRFLKGLCDSLSDENIDKVKALFDDHKTKATAAELVRKITFTDLPIQGVCSESWLEMWKSVEKFISLNCQGKSFPPLEGDNCPTCLQTVEEVSAKRLASFQEYLSDQTQVESANSESALKQQLTQVRQLNFDTAPYEPVLSEIKSFNEELVDKFERLLVSLQLRSNNLLAKKQVFEKTPLNTSSFDWLQNQIERLEQQEKDVKDSDELAKTVLNLKSMIASIEDRQKILEYKKIILAEIERQKSLKKLNEIDIKTNYGSATRLATVISQEGRLGQLGAQFSKELQRLGFKNFLIETNTRGSKGKQLFKLKLAGNNSKILDIASEGEQRCIALAGFLAELTVDGRKSAVIFDDPVNSLAHRWRRKFANRIADESKRRQVIVLTHDLPFLKMLEEATGEEGNLIGVSKLGKKAGLPLEHPPWDALRTKARIGILKNRLPLLRKMYESGNLDNYNESVKGFYGKKRETWERLVEEWLLKSVVERFSRDVKTQNVRYLVDIDENKDVQIINAAMTKCSTFFDGHDTALELGIELPDIDEVESDITELEYYFKELKGRRN